MVVIPHEGFGKLIVNVSSLIAWFMDKKRHILSTSTTLAKRDFILNLEKIKKKLN